MKREKARRALRMLGYLPRWAWYALSFFIAGPFGFVFVYLLFYALNKAAQEETQAEEAQAKETHRRADSVYRDEDCTVTSDEDVSERWAQTQQSASRAQTAQTDEDAQSTSDVEREVHDAVWRMRRADEAIADPTLSAQIVSIEQSCEEMLSILKQRPQSLSEMRTFLRYYLPTTLRLLDARARLENASTPRARQVARRISEAIATVDSAFKKQIEALEEYRFIDLESEMDVLRDMLKADGLLDEQEEDPFTSARDSHGGTPLGGH